MNSMLVLALSLIMSQIVSSSDAYYDDYPDHIVVHQYIGKQRYPVYRILKRRATPDDDFTKRATQEHKLAAIPRSGLMISGRGWMPGFMDAHSFYKRVDQAWK